MKKTLIAVVVAIILILPTVAAIANYLKTHNSPASVDNAVKISITDLDGRSYNFEKKSANDEAARLIELFCNINDRAEDNKIPSLPNQVASGKYFRIIISTVASDSEYHYYMSQTPSLCYISMPDGTVCKPTENDVKAFLDSGYAMSLYESAYVPVLTVANSEAILPDSADWSYKNYKGDFVKAQVTTAGEDKPSFSVSGAFDVKFALSPDSCNVKITASDGTELFNDFLENIKTLSVSESTTAKVEITAEWKADSNREYYGKSSYSFDVTFSPAAVFYLNDSNVKPDDVIAFAAKNVTDASEITVECNPSLGSVPKFYGDGTYAHAVMAIPANTAAGDYTVKITYGSVVQEIVVKVTERAYGQTTRSVAAAIVSSCLSDEATAEFDTLVKRLAEQVVEEKLFDEGFGGIYYNGNLYPNFSASIFYGQNVTIEGSNITYKANGLDYTAYYADSEIPAANAGKVVFAGETAYTGKCVVIEHGLGLKTWYWNLSEISVKEGDMVEKHQTVGVSGNTGFFVGNIEGVHIAMSVGDTFVCSYPSWPDNEEGPLFKEFN